MGRHHFKQNHFQAPKGFGLKNTVGCIIVFEGIDSSGKTTQAAQLFDFFQRRQFDVELVKFPRYQTEIGALIKKYLDGELGAKETIPPEAIALLYAADRFFFVKEIHSKLASGKILILDRYTASNLAHQGARFGGPSEQKKFTDWLQRVESRLPAPAITIFLDAPLPTSQQMMNTKAQAKDIHEKDALYLQKTLEIYRQLAQKEKNWIHIQCAPQNRLRSIADIHQTVVRELEKKLKLN